MILAKESVWIMVQKSLMKNVLNVIILKNESFVFLNTKKLIKFLMVLRYMTLTTSSTFPQFNSKMSLLVNEVRKCR